MKKHKTPKCQHCGRKIESGKNTLGNKTEGWAYINGKKVCQICWLRLKHQPRIRGTKAVNDLWEKWIKLSSKIYKDT